MAWIERLGTLRRSVAGGRFRGAERVGGDSLADPEAIIASAHSRDARDALGPHSLLGQLATDPRSLLTGLTVGVLQLMHPGIGAGVVDHSEFFTDPFDRIYRSLPRIVASIVADDGEERARKIRDYHRQVGGQDHRGERYHALDPETYWWAHATFTWGFLLANQRFHPRPLTARQRERYYAESVLWYRRYQLSDRPMPPDLAGFEAKFRQVCQTELTMTPAAARAFSLAGKEHFVFPLVPAPLNRMLGVTATPFARVSLFGGFPEEMRRAFDLPWPDADRRAYAAATASIRAAGRLVPERASRRAYLRLLKQLGATTRLRSAS